MNSFNQRKFLPYNRGKKLSKRVAEQPYVSPFIIIQISNVPTSSSLFEILMTISPNITTVIGIFRAADYNNKSMSETCYLICVSRSDAEFLQSLALKVEEVRTEVKILDALVGRAELKESFQSNNNFPATVMIKKTISVPDNCTIYFLAELARYFSSKGELTGIRLSYDTKHHKSQNIAFATFLNWQSALNIDQQTHMLSHHAFVSTISHNVPLLIMRHNSASLFHGFTAWTNTMRRYNLICLESNMATSSQESNNALDDLNQNILKLDLDDGDEFSD